MNLGITSHLLPQPGVHPAQANLAAALMQAHVSAYAVAQARVSLWDYGTQIYANGASATGTLPGEFRRFQEVGQFATELKGILGERPNLISQVIYSFVMNGEYSIMGELQQFSHWLQVGFESEATALRAVGDQINSILSDSDVVGRIGGYHRAQSQIAEVLQTFVDANPDQAILVLLAMRRTVRGNVLDTDINRAALLETALIIAADSWLGSASGSQLRALGQYSTTPDFRNQNLEVRDQGLEKAFVNAAILPATAQTDEVRTSLLDGFRTTNGAGRALVIRGIAYAVSHP